ncbi:hypothetical protein G4B88_003110 [Cannabis sativa]|uniref:Zinc knuckle CX2CX4HX4C domain-containing protein n=1 Tax=Cannabis sativa TaxID=3483 RepID=A0A7J6H276_CANSA|nr:hypothetical protein G4B88_003110 [Cannabis sativa]
MAENSLSHLFEETIQVITDDLTYRLDPREIDTQEPLGKVLLGKVICKGKLGRITIAGTLKKAWSSFKGWSWKEDGDGILHFTFATKEDAWNVLHRRPWIVCGALLVIMPWPSWLTPTEVKFDKSPFWVRLSATIDIDKPLFSVFFMKREAIKDLLIQYKYEKLPKMRLKCGIISHDHKFCLKPPTIIKDQSGAFFPMFGIWMKHEETAKGPFAPNLPKWCQAWIIQKMLTVDQTFKQQWKISNSIKVADDWGARESRRQLPGKRQMVEQVVEDLPATGEEKVCHFIMVTLPGVGDICHFEDTATLVI